MLALERAERSQLPAYKGDVRFRLLGDFVVVIHHRLYLEIVATDAPGEKSRLQHLVIVRARHRAGAVAALHQQERVAELPLLAPGEPAHVVDDLRELARAAAARAKLAVRLRGRGIDRNPDPG